MRTESPSLPALQQHSSLSLTPPASFTLVPVSSADMMRSLPLDLLRKVKPCVYNPASHTLRLLVSG